MLLAAVAPVLGSASPPPPLVSPVPPAASLDEVHRLLLDLLVDQPSVAQEALRLLETLADPSAPLVGSLALAQEALTAPPAAHALRVPGGAWSGDLVVRQPTVVEGDLVLADASLRFEEAGSLFVVGGLVLERTTLMGQNTIDRIDPGDLRAFREDLPRGPEAMLRGLAALARPDLDSVVRVAGPLRVLDADFSGTTLAIPAGGDAASVERSTFHDGSYGILSARTLLDVKETAFHTLRSGFVGFAPGQAELDAVVHDTYPQIQNSTFENNVAGLNLYGGAGWFHHNLGRGNFWGLLCQSAGWEDANGDLHKPLFERNNWYTNLGEGVSGLRGVTVDLPPGLPDITLANSRCDHEHNYVGEPGATQDSIFLSNDDTWEDQEADPNANSAPALPLPLTEITSDTTWDADRELKGPVVVNSPARLTIEDATILAKSYFLGSKVGGETRTVDSTIDTNYIYVVRTDEDTATGSTFGSPQWGLDYGGGEVAIYRNNATLSDDTFLGWTGMEILSGVLTDDTQWRPTVEDSDFKGSLGVVTAFNVKVTLRGNTFKEYIGVYSILLAAVILDDNELYASVGFIGDTGTVLASTGNRFHGGSIASLSVLVNTMTFTNDVFDNYYYSHVPIIDTSVTVSLSNFTLNQNGIYPLLTSVAVTNSNFFDNFPQAMVAIPLDIGVEIPTGITCANCFAPDDESWFGNVTFTAALVPNAAQSPAWKGKERIAYPGKTVEVSGDLFDGPAIARSNGTLRVTEATLEMSQLFPLVAKGGGMANVTKGILETDNATLRWVYDWEAASDFRFSGYWSSVMLNSTKSSIHQTRFEGFYQPLTAYWNGLGTIECVEVPGYNSLAVFYPGQGAGAMELKRVLHESFGTGVSVYTLYSLPDVEEPNATVLVEDSAAAPVSNGWWSHHGPLVYRSAPSKVTIRDSNLLAGGAAFYDYPYGPNLTAFDARDNYWGVSDGPNKGGGSYSSYAYDSWLFKYITPLTSPYASTARAPAPCIAWDVVSDPPIWDDGPAVFRDRSFDPSGLGVTHTWDWDDDTTTSYTVRPGTVEHAFPTWGVFTINLTLDGDSGSTGTVSKDVRILKRPEPSFTLAPDPPLETDQVLFTDTSDDPDGEVVARDWAFGDGGTSTAKAPTHRFADGGTYDVTVTPEDDDGLTKSLTSTVAVGHAPPAPDFAFKAKKTDVTFLDRSTHPNPADAPAAGWTYAWDFGDGTGATSAEREPAHAFPALELYTVTLTVTDNDGMTATLTKDVDLRNKPPVPDFHLQGPSVAQGETYFVDDSFDPDPDGAVVEWLWEFGDGGSSVDQDPTHVYADGGDYTVVLTVTDDLGAANTTQQEVHVCETGVHSLDPAHLNVEACEFVSAAQVLQDAQGLPGEAEALAGQAAAQAAALLDEVCAQVPGLPQLATLPLRGAAWDLLLPGHEPRACPEPPPL